MALCQALCLFGAREPEDLGIPLQQVKPGTGKSSHAGTLFLWPENSSFSGVETSLQPNTVQSALFNKDYQILLCNFSPILG